MQFSDGQQLLIQIENVVDAQGQPTVFSGTPAWSTSDATILNPAPASDGMSATGTALKTGSVIITVVADGVTEAVAITVGAGAVVSFQLVVSVVPAAPAS